MAKTLTWEYGDDMTPCDVKGPESHYAAVLDLHEAKPVRPSLLLSLIAQYFFTGYSPKSITISW